MISEGTVGEGDEVKVKTYEDGERTKLTTFFRDKGNVLTKEVLKKYLRLPIDARSRKNFESQLRQFE